MTIKKPHADTRLAKFVEKRVLELRSRKSQIVIATEAGFVNPNMVSMIRSGASKLALDRVPALAAALECDPKHLFRMAVEQTWGSTSARAIDEIYNTIVTRNEVAWLEEIRDASGGTDPALTQRLRSALRAVFGA